MDGEAWGATVRGVAKSRTRLSDYTTTTGQPDLRASEQLATQSPN